MPVERAALDAYLRAHQDAFVEELAGLVRLPSISTQADPGVRACAEALLKTLGRSGLEAQLLGLTVAITCAPARLANWTA